MSALTERCHATLEGNWVSGRRGDAEYAYTRPSPSRYQWQWYWDSCFAAIAWRHFDPQRSRAELTTLLAAARPDGFIGHTIFWGEPLRGPRRLFSNVLDGDAPMTSTIQPPLLALAWRIAVGDPAGEPAILRHHEWLSRERDLDGDGLLWLVQPDESGLDAAPQFDPIWGSRAQGMPGFVLLVRRNRRLGFRIADVARAGGPLVCEVMTNVLWGLARMAAGQPSITDALIDRCWDERRGIFLSDARPAPRAAIPLTWAALAPLALPDLPEVIGRRLVEEHLLNRERFWTAVAPPSVALCEPSFAARERFWGLRRYWRGPTWVNSAWMLWLGLRRLGYGAEADTLAAGICAAVTREGPREFYDPHTGAGMGAKEFAWSTLAVELELGHERAIGSYVASNTT